MNNTTGQRTFCVADPGSCRCSSTSPVTLHILCSSKFGSQLQQLVHHLPIIWPDTWSGIILMGVSVCAAVRGKPGRAAAAGAAPHGLVDRQCISIEGTAQISYVVATVFLDHGCTPVRQVML